MIYSNQLKDYEKDFLGTPEYHQNLRTLCVLLAPMAPHIASELWEALGEAGERLHIPKPKVYMLYNTSTLQWDLPIARP